MPELAEVEFFRKQWDPGLGQEICAVALHGEKRIFRGSDPELIARGLSGQTFLSSEARAKQILLGFSGEFWLGLHMGMSGQMRREPPDFSPGKADHLVLFQAERALVFSDPRMFGRVRFEQGTLPPAWWQAIPPSLLSKSFTLEHLQAALASRRRAPLKAVLLDQELFPGVGNWMADEILWQAGIHPRTPAAELLSAQIVRLRKMTRHVCETALKTIGIDWRNPPESWLFAHRWSPGGLCPRDHTPLERAQIGGRTSVWCSRCQPSPPLGHRAKG